MWYTYVIAILMVLGIVFGVGSIPKNQKYRDFTVGQPAAVTEAGTTSIALKFPSLQRFERYSKSQRKNIVEYRIPVIDRIILQVGGKTDAIFDTDLDQFEACLSIAALTAMLDIDDQACLWKTSPTLYLGAAGSHFFNRIQVYKIDFPKIVCLDDTMYITIHNNTGHTVTFSPRIDFHMELADQEQLSMNTLRLF